MGKGLNKGVQQQTGNIENKNSDFMDKMHNITSQ